MRILFLTNYFPPHEIGGQGRSCEEVFAGLQARGHTCRVLTSMHGIGNRPEIMSGVHRELYLEMDSRPFRHMLTFFTERHAREAHNLQVLDRLITDFSPDVVFIWGMWNLPVSLPALAEQMLPRRVAYRFAEYWPTLPSQHEMYWQAPARNPLTALPKKLLKGIALRQLAREPRVIDLAYPHVMCVSAGTKQALVEAGVPIGHAQVIHTGIDTDRFSRPRSQPVAEGEQLLLLYAGRLAEEKGIDTVLQAMAINGQDRIRFSVAGPGTAAFVNRLKHLAGDLKVDDRVRFLGRRPPEEIPGLMGAHHVLVVPSTWPEPFARVVLEGMAAGMVVVGTPTGGTGEILEDGDNALVFPAGDADALAAHLAALAESPALRERLAQAGRLTVREGFTQAVMMDRIEALLMGAAAGSGA